MITMQKKLVVDAEGNPTEVIISWEDYQKIAEMLGLDLDDQTIAELNQARRDRESGDSEAYHDLDAI